MGKIIITSLCVCLLWAGSALAAMNINRASEEELTSLKGIGPVKARAIVEYRQRNGPFRSVAELDRVKGIGPKTVRMLGDAITVSQQGTGGESLAGQAAAAYPGTVRTVPGYNNRWVNY